MNSNIKIKKKNRFPYSNINLGKFKYKIINDKLSNINKDFRIFLDDNKMDKKFKNRRKSFHNSFNIMELIKNIISKSSNNKTNMIKKFKKDFQKNNKKFLNDKEIHKFKEHKHLLIKLISHKTHKNQKNINDKLINKHYIGRNNINRINSVTNLSNTMIGFKHRNSTSIDNKFFYSTKSIGSQGSFKNIFYDEKKEFKKNINNIKRIRYIKKNTKIEKIYGRRDSNSNKNSIDKQNTNINSYINASNDNEKDITNYHNLANTIINNNNINYYDNNISLDAKKIYKKIKIKKLKLKIDKYENSKKYLANDEVIQQNIVDPFIFIRKKFLKKFEINNSIKNKKGFYSTMNKGIKKRKILSAPKFVRRLYKTPTSTRKDNSTSNDSMSGINRNSTMLINKLDNINKKIKIKKKILRKQKNDIKINYVNNIVNYYQDNQIYENITKEMKNDIKVYFEEIGHFIYVNRKNMFSSHLPLDSKYKYMVK